ncbi:MAG: hypothetical protein QM757_36330 [Paludibaculum sp.]
MPLVIRHASAAEAQESPVQTYVPEDPSIHKLHALEIAIIVATILFFTFVIAAGFLLRHAGKRRRQMAALEEAQRQRDLANSSYFGNYNEMALRGHYVRDSYAIEREQQNKSFRGWVPAILRGGRRSVSTHRLINDHSADQIS